MNKGGERGTLPSLSNKLFLMFSLTLNLPLFVLYNKPISMSPCEGIVEYLTAAGKGKPGQAQQQQTQPKKSKKKSKKKRKKKTKKK